MLLALVLGACSSPGVESNPDWSTQNRLNLRFAYSGIAETGWIDQTITITNPSKELAAIPTLSFVALDENSQPLEGVSVTTVFGSDKGLVVAPANYNAFDILRFEGAGSANVADVRVTVETILTTEDSGTVYPEVVYLDAQGNAVEFPDDAHTVRVLNTGENDYVVRLVGIRWSVPAKGQSQQASSVSSIGDPVRVAADSHADMPLPAEAVGQFDSLKAYISID